MFLIRFALCHFSWHGSFESCNANLLFFFRSDVRTALRYGFLIRLHKFVNSHVILSSEASESRKLNSLWPLRLEYIIAVISEIIYIQRTDPIYKTCSKVWPMLEIVVTSNASIYAISVNDYCLKNVLVYSNITCCLSGQTYGAMMQPPGRCIIWPLSHTNARTHAIIQAFNNKTATI